MPKKLIVQNESGEVWIIDLDSGDVRELTGGERDTMAKSLDLLDEEDAYQNLTHAIYGDDIVEQDSGTGHDKHKP